MNAQIPLPSFEDIRKILQFWIDQQDKWFYFEIGTIQIGSTSQREHFRQGPFAPPHDRGSEIHQFVQSRIVGKIRDIISYPPSLLLTDVTSFTVKITFELQEIDVIKVENRKKYGLVFSQITYYEPIDDVNLFMAEDPRVVNE